MTRDEVVSMALSARTLEECAAAREEIRTYIADHPKDRFTVLQAGEQVALMESALKRVG